MSSAVYCNGTYRTGIKYEVHGIGSQISAQPHAMDYSAKNTHNKDNVNNRDILAFPWQNNSRFLSVTMGTFTLAGCDFVIGGKNTIYTTNWF